MTHFEHTQDSRRPSQDETAYFRAQGIMVDAEGRPIHPDIQRLIASRAVRYGKGEFWHWGPNPTADPIVMTQLDDPLVLTIIRRSNNLLAVPGGFVDRQADGSFEDPVQAAIREAWEETSLDISADQRTVIYDGPVRDDRETANAWPTTTGVLFLHNKPSPVVARDDAVPGSAAWRPASDLLRAPMHGSHQELIRLALEHLDVS